MYLCQKMFKKMSMNYRLQYGQGGILCFQLTKRTYHINFNTIWQDYCQIEIKDNQLESLNIVEQLSQTTIHDRLLSYNPDQYVHINVNIPQDYTLLIKAHATINHVISKQSHQIRSMHNNFIISGQKNALQWGKMSSQSLEISNLEGIVNIQQLIICKSKITCEQFYSKKVMFSEKFKLMSPKISIRSLIAYGNAVGEIQSNKIDIEGLSGFHQLKGGYINVKKLYAKKDEIDIKGDYIQKISVQSGTGSISTKNSHSLNNVVLGKHHPGRIIKLNDYEISIID